MGFFDNIGNWFSNAGRSIISGGEHLINDVKNMITGGKKSKQKTSQRGGGTQTSQDIKQIMPITQPKKPQLPLPKPKPKPKSPTMPTTPNTLPPKIHKPRDGGNVKKLLPIHRNDETLNPNLPPPKPPKEAIKPSTIVKNAQQSSYMPTDKEKLELEKQKINLLKQYETKLNEQLNKEEAKAYDEAWKQFRKEALSKGYTEQEALQMWRNTYWWKVHDEIEKQKKKIKSQMVAQADKTIWSELLKSYEKGKQNKAALNAIASLTAAGINIPGFNIKKKAISKGKPFEKNGTLVRNVTETYSVPGLGEFGITKEKVYKSAEEVAREHGKQIIQQLEPTTTEKIINNMLPFGFLVTKRGRAQMGVSLELTKAGAESILPAIKGKPFVETTIENLYKDVGRYHLSFNKEKTTLGKVKVTTIETLENPVANAALMYAAGGAAVTAIGKAIETPIGAKVAGKIIEESLKHPYLVGKGLKAAGYAVGAGFLAKGTHAVLKSNMSEEQKSLTLVNMYTGALAMGLGMKTAFKNPKLSPTSHIETLTRKVPKIKTTFTEGEYTRSTGKVMYQKGKYGYQEKGKMIFNLITKEKGYHMATIEIPYKYVETGKYYSATSKMNQDQIEGLIDSISKQLSKKTKQPTTFAVTHTMNGYDVATNIIPKYTEFNILGKHVESTLNTGNLMMGQMRISRSLIVPTKALSSGTIEFAGITQTMEDILTYKGHKGKTGSTEWYSMHGKNLAGESFFSSGTMKYNPKMEYTTKVYGIFREVSPKSGASGATFSGSRVTKPQSSGTAQMTESTFEVTTPRISSDVVPKVSLDMSTIAATTTLMDSVTSSAVANVFTLPSVIIPSSTPVIKPSTKSHRAQKHTITTRSTQGTLEGVISQLTQGQIQLTTTKPAVKTRTATTTTTSTTEVPPFIPPTPIPEVTWKPTAPVIAVPPTIGFGFVIGKKIKKGNLNKKFIPSVTALAFSLKGKQKTKGYFSGLELRYIPEEKPKRRKGKKKRGKK